MDEEGDVAADYDRTEAQQDLSRRQNLPVKDSVYEHYKGGLYTVEAVGLLEETGEPMVAYRSNSRGTTWFRTVKNFQEHVDLPDGHSLPRFRRIL